MQHFLLVTITFLNFFTYVHCVLGAEALFLFRILFFSQACAESHVEGKAIVPEKIQMAYTNMVVFSLATLIAGQSLNLF